MQKEFVERVYNHPKYKELVSKRSRFGWTLALIMLVIYYGFIGLIAFDPSLLGTPLWDNTVITLGLPLGLGVILGAFLLTGLYVFRANAEFDRLTDEIMEDLQ